MSRERAALILTLSLSLMAMLPSRAENACGIQSSPIGQPGATPIAVDDYGSFPVNTSSILIPVLQNDVTPSGTTIIGTAGASRGVASISGSQISYQATAAGAGLTDEFTYTIRAGSSTSTARVQLGAAAGTVTFDYSCAGTLCTFLPQPSIPAGLTGYEWNWGTNTESMPPRQTVTHNFPTLGSSWTVSLTAVYQSGARVTGSRLVTVSAPHVVWHVATADLMAGVDVDSINTSVWNNDPVNYRIDWGDGIITNETGGPHGVFHEVVWHTYAAAGVYQITFIVNDLQTGAQYRFPQIATVVNSPPVPAIHTAHVSGRRYSFTAAETADVSAGGLKYTWEFHIEGTQSSQVVTSYNRMETHTYTFAPGRNTIRLTVTDTDGVSAVKEAVVDVPNQAPAVNGFLWECNDLTCVFWTDGTVRDPDDASQVLSLRWKFGDGEETDSDGSQVAHTYAGYGPRNVELTATDGLASSAPRINRVTPSPLSSGPLHFFAVAPCELYDSEKESIPSWNVRSIDVTQSTCGIPAHAKAVAANITVTTATGTGFLQVDDQANGAAFARASILNFTAANVPRANAVIAPVTNGMIHVMPSVLPGPDGKANVGVHVGVTGYFAADTQPAGGASGPLGFNPWWFPQRLYDTRLISAPLAANEPRVVSLPSPDDAEVLVGTLTAVSPTEKGTISLFAGALSRPPSAVTMPVAAGTTRANGFISALSTAGLAGLSYVSQAGASTHLLVDTTGYFGRTGMQYYPLRPCRTVDTTDPYQDRIGSFPGWMSFRLAGNCGVPDGAYPFVVLTVVNPSSAGWGVIQLRSTANPQMIETSTIQYGTGEVAIAAGTVTSGGDVYLSSGAQVLIDVYGYFDVAQGGGQ